MEVNSNLNQETAVFGQENCNYTQNSVFPSNAYEVEVMNPYQEQKIEYKQHSENIMESGLQIQASRNENDINKSNRILENYCMCQHKLATPESYRRTERSQEEEGSLKPKNEQISKQWNSKDLTVVKRISESHLCEKTTGRIQILTKISLLKEDEIIFNPNSKIRRKKSKGKGIFRGSNYRGVSANGKSWQVFIVISKDKKYAGCENTQEAAALLYDKLAIIFHGIKAKTNFGYTKQQVMEVIDC